MTAKNFLMKSWEIVLGEIGVILRKDGFDHHLRLFIYKEKANRTEYLSRRPLPFNIDYLKCAGLMKSWNHLVVGMGGTLVFLLNEYFVELNQAKLKFLNWIFREKRFLNNFLNWIFPKKIILKYPFNWIFRAINEWIIFWINICHFWWKAPFFFVYFGHFLGTFPIRPVLMIPWLWNWIIFWIESTELCLNWIIFWIESWVKQYWIEYWMNNFLAKFKHWIES